MDCICKNCTNRCLIHNLRVNPFPYLTPTLCNHICETSCLFKCSFKIQEIEQGIKSFEDLTTYKDYKSVDVTIIGMGITGLTIAHTLLKHGYRPYISTNNQIGGLLTDTIPQYRIETLNLFKKHIKIIEDTCNNYENFDVCDNPIAVYCRGCQTERKLYQRSITGLTFLKQNYNQVIVDKASKIVIIGLGNTSCDIAEKLKDYDTTIIYRKSVNQSHANIERINEILQYTKIVENYSPTEEELSGYDLIIECTGFIKDEKNYIEKFDYYGKTLNNIYVGGDEYLGASSINECILSGLNIAKDIINVLNARKNSKE